MRKLINTKVRKTAIALDSSFYHQEIDIKLQGKSIKLFKIITQNTRSAVKKKNVVQWPAKKLAITFVSRQNPNV
jgi:hypothetical protein